MTMVVASCVICPSVPAPVRAASRPAGGWRRGPLLLSGWG